MILYHILLFILVIPAINSNKEITQAINITDKSRSSNTTHLPLQSSVTVALPEKLDLTSKGSSKVDLLNVDEEYGKTDDKPVHARKGADLEDVSIVKSKSNMGIDLNTLEKNSSVQLSKVQTTAKEHKVDISTEKYNNSIKYKEKNPEIYIKKEEAPKKPLKTVYETVVSLGQQMPVMTKSSAQTILDQIPSPKRESVASKNPGLITPIVITILVVPMFAVLGYMALKRGQEAWKNRHYKRMDFLLDGMYND